MTIQDNSVADTFDDDDDDMDSMDAGSLGQFAYALNDDHYIRFQRRGPGLLVSFEIEPGDTDLADVSSRFHDLAEDMDWSTLTLVSRGNTWFRAPEVINFFDALVDGTLLDQFADVLFYGQGAGGHAALAYALTAPGARVLALAPHVRPAAEGRFAEAAKVDFTTRYAIEPDNLTAAQSVLVLHDPNQPEDRSDVHALAETPARPLACRNMGSDIEAGLSELGLLEEMVVRAMEGELDTTAFYRALRVRRDDPAWLRRLIGRLIAQDRPLLEALAVRNVARRTGRHRFTRRFEQIEADLAQKGITIPAARTA